MSHNIRCEYANPKSKCTCKCGGKLHGIRYGYPLPVKKERQTKIIEEIEEGECDFDELLL